MNLVVVPPAPAPPLDPALIDALARVRATSSCPQYLADATTGPDLVDALRRYTATSHCPLYLKTAAAGLLDGSPAR